jgi:hypothetical protein
MTARFCGLAHHRYNLVRLNLLEEVPQDAPQMATLTQSEELWPSFCMPPITMMKCTFEVFHDKWLQLL